MEVRIDTLDRLTDTIEEQRQELDAIGQMCDDFKSFGSVVAHKNPLPPLAQRVFDIISALL